MLSHQGSSLGFNLLSPGGSLKKLTINKAKKGIMKHGESLGKFEKVRGKEQKSLGHLLESSSG